MLPWATKAGKGSDALLTVLHHQLVCGASCVGPEPAALRLGCQYRRVQRQLALHRPAGVSGAAQAQHGGVQAHGTRVQALLCAHHDGAAWANVSIVPGGVSGGGSGGRKTERQARGGGGCAGVAVTHLRIAPAQSLCSPSKQRRPGTNSSIAPVGWAAVIWPLPLVLAIVRDGKPG